MRIDTQGRDDGEAPEDGFDVNTSQDPAARSGQIKAEGSNKKRDGQCVLPVLGILVAFVAIMFALAKNGPIVGRATSVLVVLAVLIGLSMVAAVSAHCASDAFTSSSEWLRWINKHPWVWTVLAVVFVLFALKMVNFSGNSGDSEPSGVESTSATSAVSVPPSERTAPPDPVVMPSDPESTTPPQPSSSNSALVMMRERLPILRSGGISSVSDTGAYGIFVDDVRYALSLGLLEPCTALVAVECDDKDLAAGQVSGTEGAATVRTFWGPEFDGLNVLDCANESAFWCNDRPMTREEAAILLGLGFGPITDGDANPEVAKTIALKSQQVVDLQDASQLGRQAISDLYYVGVLRGTAELEGETYMLPTQEITRGQWAAMLKRQLGRTPGP